MPHRDRLHFRITWEANHLVTEAELTLLENFVSDQLTNQAVMLSQLSQRVSKLEGQREDTH